MKRVREERYRVVESLSEMLKLLPKINAVCQNVLGEKYLREQIIDSSLLVKEDSNTGDLNAALFYSDGWGPKYITMCASRGHGREMFNEFLNRFNPSEIEIDSIPSAVGFWRKLGFRVRANCGDVENENIQKVIDRYTSKPFDSIYPDEDEEFREFLHLVQPTFDEDEMEEFILNEEERIAYKWLHDFRKNEGLRMKWCKPKTK